MPKHGKRYNALQDAYDHNASFPPDEAMEIVKKIATAKFDETVEIHIRTGLDPRHADQQLRGTAQLPHGLGKAVRVAVFAAGEGERLASEAGADVVGGDDLIARVEIGFTDFDVAIAERELMGKVGRLGRVLGPRGLMPNPRAGTVVETADIPRAVQEAKAGRVEFRVDRLALVHVPLGKASFEKQQLLDNMATVVQEIVKNKPSGAKGNYIRGLHLTTTMGSSVRLEPQSTLALGVE